MSTTRRYGAIFVAALAVALLATFALRRPRPAAPPVPAAVAAESVAVAVELLAGGDALASPDAIDAGRTVALAVTNRDRTPRRLRLAGYEDRVDTGALAPGATWHGGFVADRPGDDFAWLVDGRPAGRLDVRGSHLVEGHR
jgi:hypothetical protein